jgi:Zn-dependent peptidase ImmA (M78 family)/transcriptional regulator with XRE-family HTH domain
VAVHLEIDPDRLRALRESRRVPLAAAAERARVPEEALAHWETTPTPLPIDTCQKIAKTYKRNWYIFLLEDEIGNPTVPHDFRKGRGEKVPLGPDSMLAFDGADLLLDRIESVNGPDPGRSIVDELPARLDSNPEAIAAKVRRVLGVAGQPESNPYGVLRFWRFLLSDAGLFVSQVKFPREEMRAFCRSRNGHHLIVLSSRDVPTARSFSLLHELGHLLLGGDALCKATSWAEEAGSGAEPWCNRFAAAVLLPRLELQANPRYHELIAGNIDLGSGRTLASEFGVSELALFRRLERFGEITNAEYRTLQDAADKDWEAKEGSSNSGILPPPKRVVYAESPLFVRQVFDAFAAGDVSLKEMSSLLNTPVHSLSSVREEAA